MQSGALLEVLVRILVDQMCFLELSSDDVVNPDLACKQMEGIVAEFDALSADDRQRLVSLIQALAAEVKEKEAWRLGSPHFQRVVDCMDGIPEAYGLLDEDT